MRRFYVEEFKKVLPVIIRAQNKKGFFGPINNARWQEAIMSLVLWDKERLKRRIIRGIEAWSRIQNKNGSFPEDGKESYAATAFSVYVVAKCINELNISGFSKNMRMACEYLVLNNKIETSNQEIFSGLALLEASEALGEYKKEGIKKIKNVIKNQSKEGWFPEYFGPDIGYGTLTLQALGLIFLKKILRRRIINSAKKFVEWVKYFIFPDGSLGGSFNTRRTGWLILDGFEIFKKKIPIAEKIIQKHIEGHKRGLYDATHLIDKRHIMTDAWRLLSAYKNSFSIKTKEKLPSEHKKFSIFFKESKTYIFKTSSYMGIISANENSRCGLTLWKPNKMLIDLNKKYPKLCQTELEVLPTKIKIIGYPIFLEKLITRYSFRKFFKIYKKISRFLPKQKIEYFIKEDKVIISSNKSMFISGFEINGKKEKIKNKDNIFFKKRVFEIKKGRFFEI